MTAGHKATAAQAEAAKADDERAERNRKGRAGADSSDGKPEDEMSSMDIKNARREGEAQERPTAEDTEHANQVQEATDTVVEAERVKHENK